MRLRRAGLTLLVVIALLFPSGAFASPSLLFEPYNGTIFYAEDGQCLFTSLFWPQGNLKCQRPFLAGPGLRFG
jgi:D-alanyl-D-alanine carboxypeptidase